MKYSDEFEEFWESFDIDFGTKGGKKLAYTQYLKLDQVERVTALCAIREQVVQHIVAKVWQPNFNQVAKWLKDERYNDEIEEPTETKGFIARVTDRGWT